MAFKPVYLCSWHTTKTSYRRNPLGRVSMGSIPMQGAVLVWLPANFFEKFPWNAFCVYISVGVDVFWIWGS